MEIQTIAILGIVIASIVVILYVWDRRNKQEEVNLVDAVKLAIGAGSVAGGVAYAVNGDIPIPEEIVEKATEVAQEIFVGKPEF
jgi:hypothetical protein